MFSTSSLYFLVAIFGQSIESSQAQGLQLVEGQENETTESADNENQEKTLETDNESGESSEQRLQEEQASEQNTNESKHLEFETEEASPQETSENQRRVLEFPLSIIAGIGYAAIGLWMILDKRNSKIPYIIAIVGSLVLLGIYFTSRTVGVSSLGTEPIGLLDAIVAAFQVAIVAISLYILFGKLYIKGMTVGK
jgi:cobalamin biosynthesis Mg chelatase CobN